MTAIPTKIFSTFPRIQTRRLLLREFLPEDAAAIFHLRNDPQVSRFIYRQRMETVAEAEAMVQKVRKGYEDKQSIAWTALLRDRKEIIGACGFNRIEHTNRRAEIGGELSPDFWGKGIAHEAVGAVLHFGFEKMILHSIEARILPANRSVVALLSHFGFRKEAHLRECFCYGGSFHDLAIYSVLATELKA